MLKLKILYLILGTIRLTFTTTGHVEINFKDTRLLGTENPFTFTATVNENIFTTETKIRLNNKHLNLPGLHISLCTSKHTNRVHGIKYIWKLYSFGQLLK